MARVIKKKRPPRRISKAGQLKRDGDKFIINGMNAVIAFDQRLRALVQSVHDERIFPHVALLEMNEAWRSTQPQISYALGVATYFAVKAKA